MMKILNERPKIGVADDIPAAEAVEIRAIHARFAEIGRAHQHRDSAAAPSSPLLEYLRRAGLWDMIVPGDPAGAMDQIRDWCRFTAAFTGLSSTLRSIGPLVTIANQASLIRLVTTLPEKSAVRAAWLQRMRSGHIGATAIAEPATGMDLAHLDTTLTPVADGFRLDGGKYNISNSSTCDFMLVACRHAASGRLMLVLLDSGRPGVSCGPAWEKLGADDLLTGAIDFQAVALPPDCVIGDETTGMRLLIDTTSLFRAYVGLICGQVAAPFLQDALQRVTQRRSGARPLADNQYVQGRIVDMAVGGERSTVLARSAVDALLMDREDAPYLCSMAKMVGAQDLIETAHSLLRLYGSDGYRKGAIATFVADSLSMLNVGGTEEAHRKAIFSHLARRKPAFTGH